MQCKGCNVLDVRTCEFCSKLKPLQTDRSFDALVRVALGIPGCLFPGEESFLAKLAQECSEKGVIVELGSYYGRSTVSLALGSRAGHGAQVFTVDAFEGDTFMQTSHETYSGLLANLERSEVQDLVVPIVGRTDQIPEGFAESVGLLFIDADHTYQNVSRDFEAWAPLVAVGGKIAFHDTYDVVMRGVRFLGPLQVAAECCTRSDFQALGRFQSITVIQKLSKRTIPKRRPRKK